MCVTRHWGDWIATLMSCSVGALVLVAASAASAKSQSRPSPPQQDEKGLAARHRLGLQVGGSAVAQVAYRYRMTSSLHLDVGLGGLPHGILNGSLGVIAGVPFDNRWFVYVGVGAGHAGVYWSEALYDPECPERTSGCPEGSNQLSFFYGRAGVAMALGEARRHLLGLEVGGWYGSHRKRERDDAGATMSSSRPIVWPMAGLSYFFAL
jgi:hypothetical protein